MKQIKTLTVNGQTYRITDGSAARIDDTAVSDGSTWSSSKLAETLGDVESAIDGILMIQNELMGVATVTIYKTTDPNGEKSEYLYKPGMTWEVWVASEYNIDGYSVDESGEVKSGDGRILQHGGLDEGELLPEDYIYASAVIDPNTYYFYSYD